MQLEKFSKIKYEIINNLIVTKLKIKSTRPTITQGRPPLSGLGAGAGGICYFWGRFFSGCYFQHRLGVD